LMEAEDLEVQMMKTRMKVPGDARLDTLTAMANFALTLKLQSCN
jgi:hypothetical protein